MVVFHQHIFFSFKGLDEVNQFRLPDYTWQKKKCRIFHLTTQKRHSFGSTIQTFKCDQRPKKCQKVLGDGNCLFRSLSFWLTGVEDFHREVIF